MVSCGVCSQAIAGASIVLPDSTVSCVSCHKCSKCSSALGTRPFVLVQGRPQCPHHSQSTCKTCEDVISGPFLEIGDFKVHPDCFTCSKAFCGKDLNDDPDANIFDDEFYCGVHLEEKLNGPSNGKGSANPMSFGDCGKCGLPCFGGSSLKALNKVFHTACFTCTLCGVSICDGQFVVREKEICCTSHFKPQSCGVCERKIFGDHLVHEDKAYHIACVPGGKSHMTKVAAGALSGLEANTGGDFGLEVEKRKLKGENTEQDVVEEAGTNELRDTLIPAETAIVTNAAKVEDSPDVDTSEESKKATKEAAVAVALNSRKVLEVLAAMIERETSVTSRASMEGLFTMYERALNDLAVEVKDFVFCDLGAEKRRLKSLCASISGYAGEVKGMFRLAAIRYNVEVL